MILILVARRWPFHDLQRELRRFSRHLVGFTVDMFVELVSLADSARQSVLATNPDAATAERLVLSAAILMAKEKNRNGESKLNIFPC